MNYEEMTVKQLVEVAKGLNIPGRHRLKRMELLAAIEAKVAEVQAQAEEIVEETKPVESRNKRLKVIEVWKDGELFATVDGLVETLRWAVENGICNQGWVKNSLKKQVPTVAGRKFKEGGFVFKYADKK